MHLCVCQFCKWKLTCSKRNQISCVQAWKLKKQRLAWDESDFILNFQTSSLSDWTNKLTALFQMLCLCRYYPALRTLEQLEQTCLPKAGQYRFCSIMAENIPKLRIQIRDTAMSQLRDFLESIRKHSDKIGQTAMKQVHKHPETLWAEKVQLTCSHSQEMTDLLNVALWVYSCTVLE